MSDRCDRRRAQLRDYGERQHRLTRVGAFMFVGKRIACQPEDGTEQSLQTTAGDAPALQGGRPSGLAAFRSVATCCAASSSWSEGAPLYESHSNVAAEVLCP